jgi:glycosyltransferase involved in cell wall biosynthesis
MDTHDMAPIVIISTNASQSMGGEAIKAYQFFEYLLAQGTDAYLCTHGRCRADLEGRFPEERIIFINDDAIFLAIWKSKLLRGAISLYFHYRAKKVLIEKGFSSAIWHFLCPISPVEPRLFPSSAHVVIGPLNGNLSYPSGFQSRLSRKQRLAEFIYKPLQVCIGALFRDKRRADCVLNSGGQRTVDALNWAGVPPQNIHPVCDAGLSSNFTTRIRVPQSGKNLKFVTFGRFVPYKGYDLAIDAIAKSTANVCLDIYGSGAAQETLEQQVAMLGIEDRVTFKGWIDHAELVEILPQYRGFIFPSLAEANGIVMQEMMCLGIPVVCLDWGGPKNLAQEGAAITVPPVSKTLVIQHLAEAMDRLAIDPSYADQIAEKAHMVALRDFPWNKVAASWMSHYPDRS